MSDTPRTDDSAQQWINIHERNGWQTWQEAAEAAIEPTIATSKQLERELNAATAELDALRNHPRQQSIDELLAENQRLVELLTALREDRDRMDWLDDNNASANYNKGQYAVAIEGECNSGWYDTIRAAIDAAKEVGS